MLFGSTFLVALLLMEGECMLWIVLGGLIWKW